MGARRRLLALVATTTARRAACTAVEAHMTDLRHDRRYSSSGAHHHHHHHHRRGAPGAQYYDQKRSYGRTARASSSSSSCVSGAADHDDCAEARSLEFSLEPLEDLAAVRESHYVDAFTNWLIPGHVMVGRYPGSGRGQTSVAEAVGIIVGRGIDTFVCLQSELAPLDSGRPLPVGFEPYAQLARDMMMADAEPTFVHFGIRDMAPADDLAALAALIDDLAARVTAGHVLYIHCWGGKGRTGLVAACLLVKLFGLTADKALNRLQTLIEMRIPPATADEPTKVVSPETEPQRDQVRAYVAQYHSPPHPSNA